MDEELKLKCSSCCTLIDLRDAVFEQQIVSKTRDGERIVAVCYYLICPMCFHRYNCFYKDKIVYKLLDEGREKEANERARLLWELFEDGC